MNFKVRFKEEGRGRDGGLGKVKSFTLGASNHKKASKKASRKLRKRGRILSIRKCN